MEEENNVVDIFTKEPVDIPSKKEVITDNDLVNDMFDNCKIGNFTNAVVVAKDFNGTIHVLNSHMDIKDTVYSLELAKDLVLKNT